MSDEDMIYMAAMIYVAAVVRVGREARLCGGLPISVSKPPP